MKKRMIALTMAAAMAVSVAVPTAAMAEEVPKLSIYIDETWWPYETWEGTIPEEFEKRVGVDIEVTRAADGNQLALMVASGDMPDIIVSNKYQYLADESVCYPLDELHETYPDIDFPVDPVLEFVNRASDGHYYTIQCSYSPAYDFEKYDRILTEGPGFFYREDIAAELGLEFETLEDLDAAFAKVKEAYPDMAVTSFSVNHWFHWLQQQMGLNWYGYYEAEDGTLKYWLRQDGLLDFFKKVNEWYRAGYIPAENFAYQSEDESKEFIVSGNVFSQFAYDNHAEQYSSTIALNGDDYRLKSVTDELSEDCVSYDITTGHRGMYITRSCENVEAAYKTLAYARSQEGIRLLLYGIEGEDYTLDEEGYPIFNYNFSGADSELAPRGLKYWGWMACDAIAMGIAEANAGTQTAEDKIHLSAYVDRNPVIGMIKYATDSKEANINAKLDEMIKNHQTNIYMAESEEACVAAFEEMIKLAEEIGMAELEAYGNATYPELKAEYDALIAAAAE